MKRITILLVFIALFFTTNTQAQLTAGGARVGINLSDQLTKDDAGVSTDFESITGLTIAIPFEIGITQNFSVQPELTFIQQGAGVEFTLLGVDVTTNSIYNYLELPILAKYKFVNTESFKMYAAAGPAFGYALSGKEGTSNTKTKIDFGAEDYKDFQRFEMNLNFGIGFGFVVDDSEIVLDLRYRYGLTDLDKSDLFTSKNHSIALSLGYMYYL